MSMLCMWRSHKLRLPPQHFQRRCRQMKPRRRWVIRWNHFYIILSRFFAEVFSHAFLYWNNSPIYCIWADCWYWTTCFDIKINVFLSSCFTIQIWEFFEKCIEYLIVDIIFNFTRFLSKATFRKQFLIVSVRTSFQALATYSMGCRTSICFAISESSKSSLKRAITYRINFSQYFDVKLWMKAQFWKKLLCNPHKNNISNHLINLSKIIDRNSSRYDKYLCIGDFNTETSETALRNFCDLYKSFRLS